MEGIRTAAPTPAPNRAERVIEAHEFRVPRTREITPEPDGDEVQATARPASAAWAHTRSANPAKSAA